MKKLLIIDNNTLSRESIVNIIYCIENESVVYESESLEHTADINITFSQDDIVVFNHVYQQQESLELLNRLIKRFPDSKKLIITHSKDLKHYESLIENGAHGVISISSSRNDLIAALRSLKAGNLFLNQAPIENQHSFSEKQDQEKKTKMSDPSVLAFNLRKNTEFNNNVMCYANNLFAYEKSLSTQSVKDDKPTQTRDIKNSESSITASLFFGKPFSEH